MALPKIAFLDFVEALRDVMKDDLVEVDYTDASDLTWEFAGLFFLWESSTHNVYYYDAPGGILVVTGVAMSVDHIKQIVQDALEASFY